MTAVALAPKRLRIPAELEQEILARIDRAGLHICEAELHYKLRWDEREHGSLLELLDELEGRGLRDPLPAHRARSCRAARGLPAAAALRHRDPLGRAVMNAREIPTRRSIIAKVVSEPQRGGAGRPADIARRLGPDWTEDRVRTALAELFSGGVVGHNPELGFWWVA